MKKSWELFWPSPNVYTDGVDSIVQTIYEPYFNIDFHSNGIDIVFILMTDVWTVWTHVWSYGQSLIPSTLAL